jgi:chromosome transmission fidelity protein 18
VKGHGQDALSQDTILSSFRSEEEEAQSAGAPEEELAHGRDNPQHCLWVDEFAPQHYTELLSDDVRPFLTQM